MRAATFRLGWFLACSLMVFASSATAQAGERSEGERDGFYLRLMIGIGGERLTVEDGAGNKTEASGPGGGASISVGAMVFPNLALHADIFVANMVTPSVRRNGQDLGQAEDTEISLGGAGLGLTYYLMPANVYFSASIAYAWTTLRIGNVQVESDPGLGLQALVAKEFWVGSRWSLGPALQLIHANVPTQGAGSSGSFRAVNLLFSASFN